ncbi:Translation initiation factor IF-3 [Madurella mycetomatis]|uniref:Translation initiation factor IF-3 n=1 Tax=Madurella mycetomatis TaxID=100816 RepID=A0A175WDX2_9PEZI|nr:Translation initiation factor IF-3 [Madurella mycetomatis]
MRGSQCLLNSAAALRMVFVSSAFAPEVPVRLLLPTVARSSQLSFPLRRAFSTQHVVRFRNSRPIPNAGKSPASGPMRNFDITYPYVQIRGHDNRLAEPERTNTILRQLDLARNDLVLVAHPRRDPSAKGPEYPICIIEDRRAKAAEQAGKDGIKYGKKKREPRIIEKELEVNWAIAPNDLRTRMKQLKTFLSKGYKVQVRMLVPKKRDKRRATPDEAKEVFRIVQETIAEVPGTTNYKPMEGNVGQMVTMFLQGPTGGGPSAPKETATVQVTEEATVKEAGP